MRYLIIGLGIYGANLARDLTDMGHEVIGADNNASNVEAIKDFIAKAYIIDSTDEASLSALPLKNVDLVIVAIGENFGASVKTVALLKKNGVKNIFARAIDELHQSILEGLKVQRILTPEQRAAHDLVNEMELNSDVATLRVSQDSLVMRFQAPSYFYQMKYADITPDILHGLRLIAATRPTASTNILGITRSLLQPLPLPNPPVKDSSLNGKNSGGSSKNSGNAEALEDLRVQPGDVFVCLGSSASYKALFRHIN
jgi:trk system potassium uptake protein TrkA